MKIEINLNTNYEDELKQLNENLIEVKNTKEDIEPIKKRLKEVYLMLNNTELKVICMNILKGKYNKELTITQLHDIIEVLESFNDNLKDIKEDIDLSEFLKEGEKLDIKGLKKIYKDLGRDKLFPNFKFKRLKELFENPPTELKPQDNMNDLLITYDPFIVRKYLYGIIQMVINEMDLLIGFVGGEGMGKSAAASQDINLLYYLLKELGLINYKYNIKDLWFNSLETFQESEDKFFNEKFRIMGLDEGNELNKHDWQNDSVKLFFQRLRRERYNQRIKIICLPQLGELITNIVLSRMNFVFHMYSKNRKRTGTIDKGYCNYYIIPRNETIYSPAQKREIPKDEIIDTLGAVLEDRKKYLKNLPNSLLIKSFRRNHIWGFNVEKYRKTLKESNKGFNVGKGIKMSEYQAFLFWKYVFPKLKDSFDLKNNKDKKIYSNIKGLKNKVEFYFSDPAKELLFKQYVEEKLNS